jgi:hypothetical protein
MCVQTEDMWFGGRNASTTPESGLGFPAFNLAADAFGFHTHTDMEGLFRSTHPGFLEVKIPTDARLANQCRFGFPIEDSEPALPRDEFKQQMIVEPM